MKTPRTPSIHTHALALVAGLSLAAISTAQAALDVYDGFNGYSAGTIVGDNGGTGWVQPNLTGKNGASTWTDASWQNPVVLPFVNNPGQPMYNKQNDATVVTAGLNYTDPGSGQSLSTSGGALNLSRQSAMRAWGIPSTFLAGGGSTLWTSFLISPTSTASKLFVLPFGNAGYTVNGSNYQYGAGAYLNNGGSGFQIGAQIRTAGTTGGYATPATLLNLSLGQTYLVVMEFVNNGGGTGANADSVQMWVGPTLGGSAPLGTDLTTGVVSGDLDLSGVMFLRSGTSSVSSVDEFRIGDTYADVTPVPEPSTCALLLIGAGLACGAARRRSSLCTGR